MLDKIIPHINTNINTLGVIANLFELCEIVEKGDLTFPAEYQSGGEFRHVTDADMKKGIGYHRQIGEMLVEPSDLLDAQTNRFWKITYSLRFVGIIPKKIIDEDNKYIDDRLSKLTVFQITQPDIATLVTELKANRIFITTGSIETRKAVVEENEFTLFGDTVKKKEKGIRHEYSMFSIDYSVVIHQSRKCFDIDTCSVIPNPPPPPPVPCDHFSQTLILKTGAVTSSHPGDDGDLQMGFDPGAGIGINNDFNTRIFADPLVDRFAVYDWAGRVGNKYILVDTWQLQYDPANDTVGNPCFINQVWSLNPDGSDILDENYSAGALFFALMTSFNDVANFTTFNDWYFANLLETPMVSLHENVGFTRASIRTLAATYWDQILVLARRRTASHEFGSGAWKEYEGSRGQLNNPTDGNPILRFGYSFYTRVGLTGEFPTGLGDTLNGFTRIA